MTSVQMPSQTPVQRGQHDGPTPMKQLPLAIFAAPQPTLDSYVAGDNAAALAHLQGWPAAQQNASAPLYLWGPPGSGKTHLLRGLATRLAVGGAAVGWFDAHDPRPWNLQPDWALVVIDRCEALDAAAQHAAFVLFTEAATHGVPLAAAGTLPPADLALRDDLRTRLGWGLVFALHPLSDAHTRQALALEARRRGFDLPAEVTNYLLSRFPRDLSTLMALLAALDEHGLATHRRLTVPLVRDLIAQNR